MASLNKLTLKFARSICGTLGKPSKMPGTSYGISAFNCITGSKLAKIKGSTCYLCYAMRANYQYPSVKIAHAKRLAGITNPLWVECMAFLLNHAHSRINKPLPPFHRWHDSGDLQSRDHLAKICAVARATPHLTHWLPTRESRIVAEFLRDGGSFPANLTVRVSATKVDGPPPTVWGITSTVHSGAPIDVSPTLVTVGLPMGHACPAPQQGNKCQQCRACWNPAIANVSYHLH